MLVEPDGRAEMSDFTLSARWLTKWVWTEFRASVPQSVVRTALATLEAVAVFEHEVRLDYAAEALQSILDHGTVVTEVDA